MKKLILLILLAGVWYALYYFVYPAFVVMEVYDQRPFSENTEIASEDDSMESISQEDLSKISYIWTFMPKEHEVEWLAQVIEENWERILRFQNFETINWPDLYIYLSADLDAEDYVDLWKIKWTKWNINYELSSDIDLAKYKYVLVWCKPFSALFSYAALDPLQMLK